MNYLQKATIFIGIATAINGVNFKAQAQFCAEPSQTALTKARLDEIAVDQGIPVGRAPIAFQNFALATIRPGTPIPENTDKFESPQRRDKTNGKLENVVPDGVLPLVIQNLPLGSPLTYDESVFYEVKALSGGLLPPSYDDYQILGFLDALSRSDAADAGRIPAIIFLTTADVKQISLRTTLEASTKRVGVWHAIGCEVPGSFNNLQLGQASLRNPEVYILNLTLPESIGPGMPGRLFLNPSNSDPD
ncbi:hypothetical protein [Chroococcidiopsis thermalis]|uniref:Uncharacterized protein n=1 Tax=Chroococcidiopsis thermalis (strain PCC 7203) TaxID=251229 RepID=K9U428_CHRTP|nr:hypothetical protein [Chroococcidiopsis thermalis]AFY89580.1 hypothetical protein Chro_4176 [Chroococcidiopsis thermalis PCC 7203]PSB44057.1 hypothetical protein C7B80_21890 [Cyanosarcina cf. burmensis CCALA 770]